MPFLLVYAPSDFTATPPTEAGSAASGSTPFSLTLRPGATGTVIEVTDDDAIFDEVDASQVLASSATIGTSTYAAGTTVFSAYDLINTGSGLQVTSIHFTGIGNRTGPIQGMISNQPLEPGVTYTFNVNRTSHQEDNPYDGFVACLTRGAMIRTARGPVAIEDLQPGDLVETCDHGPQPLRLKLSRRIGAEELARHDSLRPVRISAGAMGSGLPHRDLLVSPQHRMLIESPICKRMFGETGVLVAATRLTDLPGIYVDEAAAEVEYFHLIFDQHEIIYADGALTESFLPGPVALGAMADDTRAEFLAIFPGMQAWDAARMIPSGRQQRNLVSRHRKNQRALIGL